MPIRSAAQRRLLFARAAEGEAWAIKYLRDSGLTPPPVNRKKKLSNRLQGRH